MRVPLGSAFSDLPVESLDLLHQQLLTFAVAIQEHSFATVLTQFGVQLGLELLATGTVIGVALGVLDSTVFVTVVVGIRAGVLRGVGFQRLDGLFDVGVTRFLGQPQQLLQFLSVVHAILLRGGPVRRRDESLHVGVVGQTDAQQSARSKMLVRRRSIVRLETVEHGRRQSVFTTLHEFAAGLGESEFSPQRIVALLQVHDPRSCAAGSVGTV